MSRKRPTTVTSFTQGSVTYRVGDNVLIKGDGAAKPFIGKIREIEETTKTKDKGEYNVQVAWYYRPEEAMGGRKQFHGEMEVFKSDHFDWVNSNTINSKCNVHSLKAYKALPRVTAVDFFARFTYKPTTNEFRPDRVPVYCKCELPYNPDHFMVMCDKCQEWFHPACLGFTRAQVEDRELFRCPDCNRDKKARLLHAGVKF